MDYPHGWTRITSSQRITDKKSILYNCFVVSNGGGAADSTIYNGIDTNGQQHITIKAPTGEIKGLPGRVNTFMERGIYIAVGSNVEEVLVIWDPIK